MDEIVLLRAKVAYLQGQRDNATALASRVTRPAALRLQAMALTARILCDKGQLSESESLLQQLQKQMASGASASVRADMANLEGTLAGLHGNPAAAAVLFDQEANYLRLASRYADMSRALARAGQSYAASDNAPLAASRYFLAARSAAAQGNPQAAKPWVASAISAAEKAGDHATLDRATAAEQRAQRSRRPVRR